MAINHGMVPSEFQSLVWFPQANKGFPAHVASCIQGPNIVHSSPIKTTDSWDFLHSPSTARLLDDMVDTKVWPRGGLEDPLFLVTHKCAARNSFLQFLYLNEKFI